MEMMRKSRWDKEEACTAAPATSRRKDGGLPLLKILTLVLVFTEGTVIAGLSLGVHCTQSTSLNEFFFQRQLNADIWGKESLSFENFIRPSPLMHTMTDEELLWRASMVAKREGYPFKRVPKVAFLFLVKGPLPLSPLWDRFFKGGEGLFTIYVHATPGYKLNFSKASAFYGRQIPSKETKWGLISLVDAERRLLANALLDFSNERFVLLSESCIPLYDFSTIYSYLMHSDHSFVHSFDDDTEYGRGRYNHQSMAPAIKLSQWRKGAQWFELHRSLAVSVVAESKYRDLFGKYHNALGFDYSDEHYLPTFLSMFHGASIANRTVTWVYWSRIARHPATFGSKNTTAGLVQSIRNKTVCMYNSKPTKVCYLFARKFSPDALQPLLDIMKF